MALILDTGPLVAAADRGDFDHARCRLLIEQTDQVLLIPAPVLPEFDYLTAERVGPAPMIALLDDIEAGAVVIEELASGDYPRVRQLIDRYADAGVGFVDAAVLAIVERLGERTLATLDRRHFTIMRPRHVDALELVPE